MVQYWKKIKKQFVIFFQNRGGVKLFFNEGFPQDDVYQANNVVGGPECGAEQDVDQDYELDALDVDDHQDRDQVQSELQVIGHHVVCDTSIQRLRGRLNARIYIDSFGAELKC